MIIVMLMVQIGNQYLVYLIQISQNQQDLKSLLMMQLVLVQIVQVQMHLIIKVLHHLSIQMIMVIMFLKMVILNGSSYLVVKQLVVSIRMDTLCIRLLLVVEQAMKLILQFFMQLILKMLQILTTYLSRKIHYKKKFNII